MNHFPKLTSNRLILDQLKHTDIETITAHANNTKIVDNTRTMPYPYFEEDAVSWINLANQGYKKKDHFIFAIRLKADKKLIGGIGLDINLQNNRAELGYWLAETFWNKGYTTEAVQEIIQFGFEKLHLNKIIAVHLTSNIASGKVMIKNKMIKEAELVDHDLKRGATTNNPSYVSLIQYRLTKKEYQSLFLFK